MRFLSILAMLAMLIVPALALAGPRSGGSFGSRGGFRSSPSYSMPRSYSSPGYSGGGSHFFFLPGWGWGGGYGFGGGFGMFGTLVVLAVVGYSVFAISRAVRRAREGGNSGWTSGYGGDDEVQVMPGRACRSASAVPRAAFSSAWSSSRPAATPSPRPGSRRCFNNRRSSCCATRIRSAMPAPRRTAR
jgi:uncharacterized membrane protein